MSNFSNEEWTCGGSQSIAAAELLTKLHGGSPSFKATMVIPLVLLSLMIIMFIDCSVFLLRNSVNLQRTALQIWVISTYSAMGSLCVIGLFMPRTAAVVSFARNFYFAVAMKKFFELILNYYGSMDEMVDTLNGAIVPANPIPFCCVCCDRNQPMSLTRLKKLKATVYQVVLVYPIAYFIQTLFAAEGLLRTSAAAQIILVIIEAIVAVSGFTCLYGFNIIGRSSRVPLQQFFIRGKFLSISLVVACNTLQSFILQILQRFKVLPCEFPYPDPQRAFLFQCFILIFELFLISLLGWFSHRRAEGGEVTSNASSPVPVLTNISTQEEKIADVDKQNSLKNVESWFDENRKSSQNEMSV